MPVDHQLGRPWGADSRTEIICAGLRGMAQWSGVHAGLCRPEGQGPAEIVHACVLPACQALVARSGGDCVSVRGGSLGGCGLGGAEERAQGSEIPLPADQHLHGHMGRAWHAAPAVLLVNHGVEKPSIS
jgi:hypothetical protein